MIRARAWAATLLLEASGLAGAAGPRLASLCARVADLASDAAHLVSPLACCPGCGATVPALALAGVEVCAACSEGAERFGRFVAAVRADAAASAAAAAINVNPWAIGPQRRREEPS